MDIRIDGRAYKDFLQKHILSYIFTKIFTEMKLGVLLTSLALGISLASCTKTDSGKEDYYKNKMLSLTIESEDLTAGDVAMIKIGAMRIDEGIGPRPRIAVNGEEFSSSFITITKNLIEEGPVHIQVLDSAWQFILEYNLAPDSSPYTLTFKPTFNEKEQTPIYYYVDKPMTGVLEIKEYLP